MIRTPTLRGLLGLLTILLMVSVPGLAWAVGPFTPPDNDLSKVIFVDYLFGPLTGAGTSPLTPVVMAFNGVVLMMAGVYLAYTLIAGTLSTANDGEVMGKKWSAMWMPIRYTLGTAAIMPVIGSGWCVAQALVVWLALQGIGAGNILWTNFIDGFAQVDNVGAVYNPPSAYRQVRETFGSMLVANTCVQAYARYNSSDSQEVLGTEGFGVAQGMAGFVYGSQSDHSRGLLPNATCGTLAFAGISYTNQGQVGQPTSGGSAVGTDLINMDLLSAGLLETQKSVFNNAQARLEVLGAQIVSASPPPTQDEVNAVLDSVTQEYVQRIGEAARTAYADAISGNGGFIETMKADGWVMAGAYYMKLAKAQDSVTRAVTTIPVMQGGSLDSAVSSLENSAYGVGPLSMGSFASWLLNKVKESVTPNEVSESIAIAKSMVDASQIRLAGGVQSLDPRSSGSTMDSSWGERLLSNFVNNDQEWWGRSDALNQNPVMMAKGMGEWMITWAWTAFFASVGTGLLTFGGIGAGAASLAAGPFTLLFGSLIIPGAMLSTYVPMMPFILWISVVIAWAVLLVEAVIAAPLWAVVHLAPDGDEVVGKGGQGYMMVLTLTLKPALMVFGLAAAFAVMKPVGFLINSTFVGAFVTNVSPGFFGLTQTIAGLFIYSVVMFTVINKVFGLIHSIPDGMLNWIGGRGSLGQTAGQIEGQVTGKALAGIQVVRTMGDQGQNMMGQAAQLNEQRRSKQMGERGAAGQEQGNINDRVRAASFEAGRDASSAERNPESQSAQEQSIQSATNQRNEALGASVSQAKYAQKFGEPATRQEAGAFLSHLNKARAEGPAAMGAFVNRWNQRGNELGAQRQPFHASIGAVALADKRIETAEARLNSGSIAAARTTQSFGSGGGNGQGPDDPSGAPPAGGGGGSGGNGGGGGSVGGQSDQHLPSGPPPLDSGQPSSTLPSSDPSPSASISASRSGASRSGASSGAAPSSGGGLMGDSLGGYPAQVSASNAVPRSSSGSGGGARGASSGGGSSIPGASYGGGGASTSSGSGVGSLPQATDPSAPAPNPNRTQMQAPEIRNAPPPARDRGPSSNRSIGSARDDGDGE